jgi:hypothetical protein
MGIGLLGIWLAGSAFAVDLVVDGTTVTTHGVLAYERVRVVNGGVLAVTPAGTGGSDGTLTLSAKSIYIDASSAIDASGRGTAGVLGGTAPSGGAAGNAGGGGSHGGLGSSGFDGTCAVAQGAAAALVGTIGDRVTEGGRAGGGVTDGLTALTAGGAAGGAISLSATALTVLGEIRADGADGDPGAWGGAGGGAGGGVLLVAETLVCEGRISARGGAGGLGVQPGGAGGGGIIEQWWDADGSPCQTAVTGGDAACVDGAAGGVFSADTYDHDGDGESASQGDCDTNNSAVGVGAVEACDAVDNDCDGVVDDGACAGCVAFHTDSGDYLDCQTGLIGATARSTCNTKSGTSYHSWVISSKAENDDVVAWLLANNNVSHWAGEADSVDEDSWVWDAPVSSVYANWNPGEPNDASGEDCLEINPNSSGWNDLACSAVLDYVCEACTPQTWYTDADGDGYGAEYTAVSACYTAPVGTVARAGDCDDTNAAVHPAAAEDCDDGVDNDCDGTADPAQVTWFTDADGDGWGDGVAAVLACGVSPGGQRVAVPGDCDEAFATSSPSDAETCNGRDDDCDGVIDEGTVCTNCTTFVGFGSTYQVCTNNRNFSQSEGDCAAIGYHLAVITSDAENLSVDEMIDRVDEDQECWIGLDDRTTVGVFVWDDGVTPYSYENFEGGQPNSATEDCIVTSMNSQDGTDYSWYDRNCTDSINRVCEAVCDATTWYRDDDGDGYGDLLDVGVASCEAIPGRVRNDADCDDSDPTAHPNGFDFPADGVDGDCALGDRCWLDADVDGYGDGATLIDDAGAVGCVDPREAEVDGDCDDGDAAVSPSAVDVVGAGDLDCDGQVACWFDEDGDGSGGAVKTFSADADCTDVYESALTGDCDDRDPLRSPAFEEVVADGIDQDCDNQDSCYLDDDNDNFGATPEVLVDDPDFDCNTGNKRTDVPGDCDDTSAAAFPGAAEIPGDGIDADCDGVESCFPDGDGDGQAATGSAAVPGNDGDCADPGESTSPTDCNDAAATVYVGAPEVVGDAIDQDCDGALSCWRDVDNDDVGGTTVITDTDTSCDDDAGQAGATGDCNDTNAAVKPGAAEIAADGIDQDCSGGDLCFVDADGDGAGTTATVVSADLDCADPGESSRSDDCNDTSAAIAPTAAEVIADGVDQDCDGVDSCFADADSDGFGSTGAVDDTNLDCADAGPGAPVAGDCNDGDASTNPSAAEGVADGADSNCDGQERCYVDADGDDYGTSATTLGDRACAGAGVAARSGDCDDTDGAIQPGAAELVDGIDNNCDGQIDLCFSDADGDGYGDVASVVACGVPNAVNLPGDCDDGDPAVNPDALEVPGDDIDDDCDGALDCWPDVDGDGQGDAEVDPAPVQGALTCDDPGGQWADDADDCDDGDATVGLGAADYPLDGIDQDCDGQDACPADLDGDSYGSPTAVVACDQPSAVGNDGDCDDTRADVSPLGVEVVGDPTDDNCDGALDCWLDADQDGFGDAIGTVQAGAGPTCSDPAAFVSANADDCDDGDPAVPGIEVADGIDNDCDGVVDEVIPGPDTGIPGETAAPRDTATDAIPSADDRPLPGAVDGEAVGCGCATADPRGLTGLLAMILPLLGRRGRRRAPSSDGTRSA